MQTVLQMTIIRKNRGRKISVQNDKKLKITTAKNRKSTNWITEEIKWSDFIKKLSNPIVTTETYEQFIRLKKSQQDELKDVGGFVAGELKNNRRKAENIVNRCLVTLDADNIEPGATQKVLNLVDGLGCGYVIYSTRKHCNSKPRLRIIIPTDRLMATEEYEPLARKIASFIGMEIMDSSTFEASRLMYWPSHSRDSEYVFKYTDKPFASVDVILKMYQNWKNPSEWPRVVGEKDTIKREIAKQKDPLEKDNIVGAFCRVYDIFSAIETFLLDVYTHGDKADKFTYAQGSVANGATVYEEGRYLYSFHATDPASRILCNSFDLVRIHKFGHLDEDVKEGTPTNRFPSYVEMCKFALEDEAVSMEYEKQKLKKAREEFSQSTGTVTRPELENMQIEDVEWRVKKLRKSSSTGLTERTINNALVILENDIAFKNKLVYDRFSNRFLIKEPMPWGRKDESYPKLWNDSDDAELRGYFEKCYDNFKGAGVINDALSILKNRASVNVAKEYFENLRWDGKARLDTLIIEYLGAEDSEYTRQVTRKAFTAVVARAITEKPIKFDNMIILTGKQGIGKSTLLSKLAGDWFTDNIVDFNSKDTLLLLQNCIIAEVPELQGFNKADSNRLKQFLGQKTDKYRAPYERREEEHPRHCVFFGTTNDDEFLRDSTGNRRYWPLQVGVTTPVKDIFTNLDTEKDQIWAEAVARFRTGEALYLEGEVLKVAEEEQKTRLIVDPWESIIGEYLQRPIPADWFERSTENQKNYWILSTDEEKNLLERDRICASEILTVCLGIEPKRQTSIDRKRVLDIVRKRLEYSYKTNVKFGKSYGQTSGFIKQN